MYMLLLLGHFRVTCLAKQYKIKTKHFNQHTNHCFAHLKGDHCEPATKKTFSLKRHIYTVKTMCMCLIYMSISVTSLTKKETNKTLHIQGCNCFRHLRVDQSELARKKSTLGSRTLTGQVTCTFTTFPQFCLGLLLQANALEVVPRQAPVAQHRIRIVQL